MLLCRQVSEEITVMSHNGTQEGDGRGESSPSYLWVIYLVWSCLLVVLALISFLHYHLHNRGKYAEKLHRLKLREEKPKSTKYRVTLRHQLDLHQCQGHKELQNGGVVVEPRVVVSQAQNGHAAGGRAYIDANSMHWEVYTNKAYDRSPGHSVSPNPLPEVSPVARPQPHNHHRQFQGKGRKRRCLQSDTVI